MARIMAVVPCSSMTPWQSEPKKSPQGRPSRPSVYDMNGIAACQPWAVLLDSCWADLIFFKMQVTHASGAGKPRQGCRNTPWRRFLSTGDSGLRGQVRHDGRLIFF